MRSDDTLSTSCAVSAVLLEFVMQAFKECFITGHSVGVGALFIPMKAAQWYFEAKNFDFLAMKNLEL